VFLIDHLIDIRTQQPVSLGTPLSGLNSTLSAAVTVRDAIPRAVCVCVTRACDQATVLTYVATSSATTMGCVTRACLYLNRRVC
jgi:hypothetical protein